MSRYFDRFPVIDYNGVVAKNIMTRVDLTDQTKKDAYANFQFTLEEGFERPDLLSYNYYGSSQFDWMIYLTNSVVDPYFDYYKSTPDFQSYIDSKYGSASNARLKTVFYRNNWHTDERLITATQYEALTADETLNLRKYWKPKLSNVGTIIGYERIKEDWIVSTNKIVSIALTDAADASMFNVGDRIVQSSTSAYAEVDFVDTDNNSLTAKHVSGTFVANEEEGILTVTMIKQNITNEEAEYWYAVTAYEDEEETNLLKRNVTVLKSSYIVEAEKKFIQQLST